jgi:hypothetical protein
VSDTLEINAGAIKHKVGIFLPRVAGTSAPKATRDTATPPINMRSARMPPSILSARITGIGVGYSERAGFACGTFGQFVTIAAFRTIAVLAF